MSRPLPRVRSCTLAVHYAKVERGTLGKGRVLRDRVHQTLLIRGRVRVRVWGRVWGRVRVRVRARERVRCRATLGLGIGPGAGDQALTCHIS